MGLDGKTLSFLRKLVVLSKLASTTTTLTAGCLALPPNAALDETTGNGAQSRQNFMDASSSSAPTAYLPLPSDGANDSAKSKSGPGPFLDTDKAPAGSLMEPPVLFLRRRGFKINGRLARARPPAVGQFLA